MKKPNGEKSSKTAAALFIAGYLIFLVLFIQVGTFLWRLADVIPNRPYKHAKVYMSAALIFNHYYTHPLQKVFGLDAPIAKPAIFIRNKLYEKGASLLPKDEGEREIWWARIVGMDYMSLLTDIYYDYGNVKTVEKYPPDYILKKYDELYGHMIPLATLEVKDKKWEHGDDGRIVTVNKFLILYMINKELMLGCKYNGCEFFQETSNNPFVSDNQEILKLKKAFDAYMDLTNKFLPNTYKQISINPENEPVVINTASNELLGADIKNNNFNCESSYTKYFRDTSKQILELFNDPNTSNFDREKIYRPLMNRPIFIEVTNYIDSYCK